MIRVGLIGFGYLGKWHAEKVEATGKAKLVAIVEKFEANQKLAKEKFPNTLVVDSIDDIIDQIDAAIIVTPTSTHFELVKYFVEKNKHVFCEKPFTDSLNDSQTLINLIKKNQNLKIQVGHSERFHEAWDIIKKDFKKYLEGPLTIRISRFAPFKGRATDVNVVDDVMIHDIDLMVYLLNSKPKSVIASGQYIRTKKYDHAHAFFEFDEGHNVSIIASRNHVKEVRDVEIASKNGLLYVDLMSLTIAYAPASMVSEGKYFDSIQYQKRDHLLQEHKYFYESIQENKKTVVDENDGLIAVKIIDAVLKSAHSQSKVVIND